MEKKYIIQIPEHAVKIVVVGIDEDGEIYTYGLNVCNFDSYSEPDLEQVRKEAYREGREDGIHDGMCDAWEAARKIADMPYGDGEKIFGVSGWHIIEKCTADEVIEELKAREQAQKEEKPISAEEVMRQYLDTFCKSNRCGECILDTSDFTCGRGYHFLTSSSVSDEEVRRAYAKVVKEKE